MRPTQRTTDLRPKCRAMRKFTAALPIPPARTLATATSFCSASAVPPITTMIDAGRPTMVHTRKSATYATGAHGPSDSIFS